MKYNYSEYCYNHSNSVNDEIIEDKSPRIESEVKIIFNRLLNRYGAHELFKLFLTSYGEYESSDKCEQCGNYDTIVNLEI